MRKLNGLDWFLGNVYHTPIRAGLLQDLVDPLREQLIAAPYSAQSVATAISDYVSRTTGESSPNATQASVNRILIESDLTEVARTLTDAHVQDALEQRREYPTFLKERLNASVEKMGGLGLPLRETPKLHFVKQMPAPYSSSGAAIIACDQGDEDAFGVSPGLYITSNYRPFYTEYILYHEMLHLYLGERHPEVLSGRLEEGLAEALGAGWLALSFMPLTLVLNLFIVNRLSTNYAGQWERYLDATRQAWRLLQRMGLDGVTELVRRGRPALIDTELRMYAEITDLHKGSPVTLPPQLDALLAAVCDLYPRSLAASPAAVLVAPYAKEGATVREVALEANMDPELALEGLRELQDVLGIAALRPDESVVVFSLAPQLASSRLLRYSI